MGPRDPRGKRPRTIGAAVLGTRATWATPRRATDGAAQADAGGLPPTRATTYNADAVTARASVCHAGPRPAAQALAEGAALAARVAWPDAPAVALYGAALTGDSVTLGAHQRSAHALDLARLRARGTHAVRRATGGPTYRAGEGVAYLALGLRTASTLLDCPRDRVLNRNVRGALAGLGAAGLPVHYFGREFLSLDRRPAIGCGWSRDARGHVLLEFFVGATAHHVPDPTCIAYPPRTDAAMTPKAPLTFAEAFAARRPGDAAPDADALVACVLARGWVATYGLDAAPTAPPDVASLADLAARDAARPDDDDALRWSGPREVPIGFVAAGLRVTGGLVADARLAGDFFADDDGAARLRDAIVGGPPTPERLVAAINAAYGAEGAVIEGLRSLAPVLDAFLEAAG